MAIERDWDDTNESYTARAVEDIGERFAVVERSIQLLLNWAMPITHEKWCTARDEGFPKCPRCKGVRVVRGPGLG